MAEYIGGTCIISPAKLLTASTIFSSEIFIFPSYFSVISPSVSYVSVSYPNSSSTKYSLSLFMRLSENFVALFIITIRSPSAMGSRVPA